MHAKIEDTTRLRAMVGERVSQGVINSLKNYLKRLVSLKCLLIVVILVTLPFHFFLAEESQLSIISENEQATTCEWKPGDPLLFNFHMSSYADGQLPPAPAHWFHFAEHMFPWFWLLYENEKASNSSKVYFNIDEPTKLLEMNSFTRFLAVMAVTDGTLRDAEFIHLPPEKHFFTVHPHTGDFNYAKHEQKYRYKNFILDRKLLPPEEDILFHLKEPELGSPELVLRKGKHVYNSESVSTFPGSGILSLRGPDKHTKHKHHGPSKECTKYMGTVGGQFPHVQRVCWLKKPGAAELFRQRFRQICPTSPAIDKELAFEKGQTRRLIVYQRNLNRKIRDIDGVISTLKSRLGVSWDIRELMHDDRTSACELGNRLRSTDVLLSTHGFQSMAAMLLPRGSMYYEIYPFRYYKPAYAPTLVNMGIGSFHYMAEPTTWYHSLILRRVSTEWCMSSKVCRGFARDSDVILDDPGLSRLLRLIDFSTNLLSRAKSDAERLEIKSNSAQWDAGEKGELQGTDLLPLADWSGIDCDGYNITPHIDHRLRALV